MKKYIWITAVLFTLAFSGTTQASSPSPPLPNTPPDQFISLDPALGVTQVGSDVTFTVSMDGLGAYDEGSGPVNPALGAFGFEFIYDPGFLQLSSYSLGAEVCDWLTFGDIVSPGSILLEYASLDTPGSLEATQSDDFTLASFTLTGLAPGFGEAHLAGISLADAWANPMAPFQNDFAFVAVDPVPVPAGIWLLGSGLLGLVGLRSRKNK